MDTYMVTLCDREGKDQRVLVRVPSSNTEDDVRDFILTPGLTSTDGRGVELDQPTVIGIRKLHIKRPPHRTAWKTLQKAAV
ncbi:hypothetical protein SEA_SCOOBYDOOBYDOO_102 [Mycobacterium phage ScoobyDoobyDoo]|nr:hypothetical protein SEA_SCOOBYDOOBYDOO_102 [Mycobacterium phage ScoobyDoobyDoo]